MGKFTPHIAELSGVVEQQACVVGPPHHKTKCFRISKNSFAPTADVLMYQPTAVLLQ